MDQREKRNEEEWQPAKFRSIIQGIMYYSIIVFE